MITLTVVLYCILAIIFFIFNNSAKVAAEDAKPMDYAGTANDPLVSLSYVNDVLKPQIEASIISKLTGVPIQAPTATSSDSISQNGTNKEDQLIVVGGGTTSSTDKFEAIQLTKNQRIRSADGSLEIIARPGCDAVIVSPFETQGLSDITDGTELKANAKAPINHLLLVPRADDRGIMVTSAIGFIMVRGDYEIY